MYLTSKTKKADVSKNACVQKNTIQYLINSNICWNSTRSKLKCACA